jgi:hypothetical protein
MSSPLLDGLRAQEPLVKRFLVKSVVLVLLFLAADRLVGWVLRHGLERYYGMDVQAQVLCIGHSHTVLGIDKVALEKSLGVPVAKFAIEGANTSDRLIMLQYYFKRQPNSVRAVVYDVDAHAFTSAGLSSSSYRLLFPFIDDPDVRDYVKANATSQGEYWPRALLCTPRYNELLLSLSVRGYLRDWSNKKVGRLDPAALANQIREGRFLHIAFDEDNLRQFEKISPLASRNGAKLFLVYIPTINLLNQAEPERFQHAIQIFEAMAAKDPNVRFLDYNREFDSCHELFFDKVHLNREGQVKVTARLAADLKELFKMPSPVQTAKKVERSN